MSQELEGTLTNEINLVGTFGTTGGGTTNYNDLINKPSINNVTLQGNKTGLQLGLVSSTDLATVATTGSYNDLTNKPTIPAAQVNSDWNSTSGVSEILNKPTLATVATSGSYDDLTNKPTIPAAQVNADWNSSSGVSEILNKPTLATVATSGSYNDLSNQPTIPVNSDFALSGLSDTDITTPSANQVLAYDGSKWGNVDLPTKAWTYNGRYEITGGATGTWDLINSIGDAKEILFSIAIGNNQRQPRWSLLMTKADFFDYGCFPDMTVSTDRIYCELNDNNNNTQIAITGTNVGSITSKITLICHFR